MHFQVPCIQRTTQSLNILLIRFGWRFLYGLKSYDWNRCFVHHCVYISLNQVQTQYSLSLFNYNIITKLGQSHAPENDKPHSPDGIHLNQKVLPVIFISDRRHAQDRHQFPVILVLYNSQTFKEIYKKLDIALIGALLIILIDQVPYKLIASSFNLL